MRVEYEIYPIPKSINYLNKTFDIGRLVIENTNADEDVLRKADELSRTYSINNELENKVNIEVDTSLSDKYDYYELFIDDSISIKAISNDAAFYALVTLEHILKQASGKVRALSIKDYASMKLRGVIEGYYGIPWGNDKRRDLIEFGARFKNNVFIFAPKDDPYHRDKWRELYPQEELVAIGKLAKIGNQLKNRYVWTITPFKKECDPIGPENFEEATDILIEKFEQLYAVGVRQFGVLGDDVGGLPRQTVVDVMHKVSEWGKDKGDVYDFVFVPEAYVMAEWGFKGDELDKYSKEFPMDVQIMFTGENVCSPVTQETVDDFKNKRIEQGVRRDPLFWLNWPVNDIDRNEFRRLFMGKASMLEPGIKNLVGVVTNPLEEAYASLPAIFQIADYTWNSECFNAQKSWEASFKYIDEDAHEELFEIAKHMSSADEGGIEGLEESVELGEMLKEFNHRMVVNGNYDFLYHAQILKEEFKKISDSVENYFIKSKNEAMKKEIKVYFDNLKYKTLAAVLFIEIIEEDKKKSLDLEKAKSKFEKALELLEKADDCKVFTTTSEFPNKELRAESGTKVINKEINKMKEYAKHCIG